jgi:hypothetical protein
LNNYETENTFFSDCVLCFPPSKSFAFIWYIKEQWFSDERKTHGISN